MTPEDFAKLIHEVMQPLQDDIKALQKFADTAFDDMPDIDSAKQELKSFMIERVSDTRLSMMKDRDSFKGERGEKGITGDAGERGAKGDIGSQGRDGIRGKQGTPGDRGQKGDSGDRGEVGVGTRGDKGDNGERGDTGKAGKAGAKGERGERGFITAVEPWVKRDYMPGELTTNNGGTWQARRKTNTPPNALSNAWEMLSDGIEIVEFNDDSFSIKMASGEIRKSGSLQGPQGEKGGSVDLLEGYDETTLYRKSLDEVKESGSVWRAIKDGLLHKPGSAKGKGQWTCIAHKGPKGDAGKDADNEAILEELKIAQAIDARGAMELLVKMVEDYFADAFSSAKLH